ncbi:terminase [Corynebacterium striatum]|nr:terminase [Corynebacterium striatum]HAT6625297.1 terminase [Corynebacterium striatum]
MMGTPSMPWQDLAADIIGEVDPATGLRRWPVVVVSVPRQSGKTALMSAVCLQRALQTPNSFVWSTAQTGQHARRNWMKYTDVMTSVSFPLSPLFRRLKSRGDEHLLIPKLGSDWAPHPPTEESLHGEQGDLNVIDEAWVFDEAEGANLMQAITPTHSTRPGAQTIIVSTRGTSASTWFHRYVDRGRAGDAGIALIDYGIGDDVDPTDLSAVAACHPAVGHTQSLDSLTTAWQEMGGAVSEFARAYGNRSTKSTERFIPLEAWEMAASNEPLPDDARVTFGTAVSMDRDETAIVAVALDRDDVPIVEVVDVRPGTRWAAGRLSELQERHGGIIVIDSIGPAGPLAAELERKALEFVKIRTADLTAAAAGIFDRLTQTTDDGLHAPAIKIRPDGALDLAAEIATTRRIGDAWTWDRRGAAGSIASLEAMTLGVFGALATRDPVEPLIY